MAEFEREILRERVRAGMTRTRERGVRVGGPLKPEALRIRRDGFSPRAIARQVREPASIVADVLDDGANCKHAPTSSG